MSEGVDLLPIEDKDLDDVSAFMAETLGRGRTPASRWRFAFTRPWSIDKPNNGFMLRTDDGRVVGTMGCIYATRPIAGGRLKVCNLTSWSVLPAYRGRSMQLLAASLKQDVDVVTNLTPLPETIALFTRLKFLPVDSSRWLSVNLPGPTSGVVSDPDILARSLSEPAREIYLAHKDLPGVWFLGLEKDGGLALVAVTRAKAKGFGCATIAYCDDTDTLRRRFARLSAFLLLKLGYVFALTDIRFGVKPPLTVTRKANLFLYKDRTGAMTADDVDILYGELILLTPLAEA